MKKKIKKLLALLMAVAMVLSLSVTAWADDVDEDTDNPRTVTTLEDKGNIRGGSTSEGPEPDDPVEVVFPTIPVHPDGEGEEEEGEGEASSVGVFDMFLDPHGLIEQTNAARYAKEDITNTFELGKRLFFLNSVENEGATRNYKNESWPLTITNKGRQPVNVDLTLDFQYTKGDFTLVSDKDYVTPKNEVDEAGHYIPNANDKLNFKKDAGDAAMYLALQIGTGVEQAIKDPYALPDNPGESATEEQNAAYNAAVAAQYQPTFQVKGNGNYLAPLPAVEANEELSIEAQAAQDAVVFAWANDVEDADKNAALAAIAALTCTLSYKEVATQDDDQETLHVNESELKTPVIIVAAAINTAAEGASGYSVEVVGAENSVLTADEVSTAGLDEGTVAFKAAGAATVTISKDGDLATVTLNVKAPDKRLMKASTAGVEADEEEGTPAVIGKNTDERVTFRAPIVGTIIHTAIPGNIPAYGKAWYDSENPPTDEDGEALDVPQGMTTAGYYWKKIVDDETYEWPTLRFQLTGDINDDNLWDAKDTTPGITFELIWDVFQRNDTNDTIEYGNSTGSQGPIVPKNGSRPSFTVNPKATTGSTAKKLSLTITNGTEDYEGYTPKLNEDGKVTMTLSNDNTLTLTYTASTNKLASTSTADYTTLGSATTVGTVIFVKEGYKDIEVTVTGMR